MQHCVTGTPVGTPAFSHCRAWVLMGGDPGRLTGFRHNCWSQQKQSAVTHSPLCTPGSNDIKDPWVPGLGVLDPLVLPWRLRW